MTIQELKKCIDGIYTTADGIEDSPMNVVIQKEGIDPPLRTFLRGDLILYVLYLIAVNGTLTSWCVSFINYLFDTTDDIYEIKEAIDTNIDVEQFASFGPRTLAVFVACDKYLIQNRVATEGKYSALYLMLLAYIAQTLTSRFDTKDAEDASLQHLNKLKLYRSIRLADVKKQEVCNDEPIKEEKRPENTREDNETLGNLLDELNELVGMERVKHDVHSLINLMRIREIKRQRGLPQNDVSLHMVFMGNPGTGKTTVARLIAKIYQKVGVLSKGHLVEVDRSGLVAGYVGQTALKVQEKITEARGGVLFIDEAYALTANRDSSDFGYEAVDTLLKGMEDYRDDFVVIVAGYPEPMAEFLESNPGLKSRFNRFIYFDDYKPDELRSIFCGMCKKAGFTVSGAALQIAHDYFIKMYENRGTNFANGRDVRNFFEKAVVHQANRLAQYEVLSDNDLVTLNEADLQNALAE